MGIGVYLHYKGISGVRFEGPSFLIKEGKCGWRIWEVLGNLWVSF